MHSARLLEYRSITGQSALVCRQASLWIAVVMMTGYQGVGGGVAQDNRRLVHLDHERRLAEHDVVARAHAREDTIDGRQAAFLRRDEAPELRARRNSRQEKHARLGITHAFRAWRTWAMMVTSAV